LALRLLQFGLLVQEFLAELGPKARARVTFDLVRLAASQAGKTNRTQSLGDGLFELKTPYDGMAYRLFFGFHDGDVVFVESLVKKSQATPKNILDNARERLKAVKDGKVKVEPIIYH